MRATPTVSPRLVIAAVVLALTFSALLASPALASDHLFNAANSAGADNRDFANPVANNPSGEAGGHSQPGTVPGEGDPKVGGDLSKPAVDLSLVFVRSGHGMPAH
jgi:hypothetical protein